MKDKIYSYDELDNIRRNLNSINLVMGHEVPRYLLNEDELSGKILSLQELDTMRMNLESIERQMGTYEPRPKHPICWLIDGFYLIFGGAAAIYVLIEFLKNFKW